jgi:hypothetical protein
MICRALIMLILRYPLHLRQPWTVFAHTVLSMQLLLSLRVFAYDWQALSVAVIDHSLSEHYFDPVDVWCSQCSWSFSLMSGYLLCLHGQRLCMSYHPAPLYLSRPKRPQGKHWLAHKPSSLSLDLISNLFGFVCTLLSSHVLFPLFLYICSDVVFARIAVVIVIGITLVRVDRNRARCHFFGCCPVPEVECVLRSRRCCSCSQLGAVHLVISASH